MNSTHNRIVPKKVRRVANVKQNAEYPFTPYEIVAVSLSRPELMLLLKLRKEIAREKGVRSDNVKKGDVLRACLRTAVVSVYGQDFKLDGMLGHRKFTQLMRELGQITAEDEEPNF
jgi:hypothetical protein